MASAMMINRPSRNIEARPPLLHRFVRTVKQRALFVPGQHLLVAVSGGPDSTALLSLLDRLRLSWELSLTAIHFNYGLRGAESEGDESFVITMCKDRRIPLVIQRPALGKRWKNSSIQAVAREVRYAAMAELAGELRADRIALGHTANDQAETMLMWMLRGAGLAGLAGMPYLREGLIVRPLLASTREEVLAYLSEEGLSYRCDSSNDNPRYRRNRIRKELLPAIIKYVPAALSVLQRQADLLREDERYLEQVAQEHVEALVRRETRETPQLDRVGFASLPIALQRRVVRKLLRMYDEQSRASGFCVVESARRFLLTGKNGASLSLKRVLLTVGQRVAFIRPRSGGNIDAELSANGARRESVSLPVPSSIFWARTNQYIRVQRMSRREAEQILKVPSRLSIVCDADRISEPLQIRNWRAGDRFCPQGMKGRSKKLQDFLTDAKVTRQNRRKIPLLVSPEGILWVIGMRQDERCAVREGTASCLVVSVSESDGTEGAR